MIGSVKNAAGPASVVRVNQAQPATVGQRLHQGDLLRTGEGGSLGVVLRDDTVISLGPDSELTLDEFVFVPAQDQMSFVSKVVKGSAVYLSGRIGKLSPDKVRVNTPTASIGIRGTKFAVRVEP